MQHYHFKVLRFLFLILLNCIVTSSLKSQPEPNSKVDSLLKISRSSKDTAAVTALLELSNTYYFSSLYDSAIFYSQQGIILSGKSNAYKLPRLLLSAAKCYYMKGINDSALLYLNQSKPYLEQASDEIKIQYNSILASVYLDQQKTDEALGLFIASASILEQPANSHLKHKLFNTYANIDGQRTIGSSDSDVQCGIRPVFHDGYTIVTGRSQFRRQSPPREFRTGRSVLRPHRRNGCLRPRN